MSTTLHRNACPAADCLASILAKVRCFAPHEVHCHCPTQQRDHTTQVAGEHRVFTADAADCVQLLRHLGERRGGAPNWRRHRPALLAEAAEFRPGSDAAAAAEDTPGTLLLRWAGDSVSVRCSLSKAMIDDAASRDPRQQPSAGSDAYPER